MRQIFITAGHRGAGTGAKGYIDEGAETIALRDMIMAVLIKKGIVCIPDYDTALLGDVVRQINTSSDKNDICIDLHFNAYNGKAHGTEVIIPRNATDIEQELADKLLTVTCATLGTKNRGIRRPDQSQHSRLAMLDDVKCNSIILEVCFCDNMADAETYRLHRRVLADTYASILERYVKQ